MDDVQIGEETEDLEVEVAEKWYEYVKVSTQRALPFADLMGLTEPEAAVTINEELRALIIQMRAHIITERLEPKTISRRKFVRVSVPATWWDHFKRDYMNRWWFPDKLFKPPVNKTIVANATFKVEVNPMLMFPQADVPTPSMLGKPYKAYMIRESFNHDKSASSGRETKEGSE